MRSNGAYHTTAYPPDRTSHRLRAHASLHHAHMRHRSLSAAAHDRMSGVPAPNHGATGTSHSHATFFAGRKDAATTFQHELSRSRRSQRAQDLAIAEKLFILVFAIMTWFCGSAEAVSLLTRLAC